MGKSSGAEQRNCFELARPLDQIERQREREKERERESERERERER